MDATIFLYVHMIGVIHVWHNYELQKIEWEDLHFGSFSKLAPLFK